MKRFAFIIFTVLFFFQGFAQLTPGNIVVVRAGDGTNVVNSSAQVVTVLEYTNAGVATVNTITFPSGATGTRLTQSGSTVSEGEIIVSQDGNYLTIAGYDAAQGTLMVNTSITDPNGVIGLIDINNIAAPNLSYQFLRNSTDPTLAGYRRGAFRSVVTTAGAEFWGGGTGMNTTGGARFKNGVGASAGTQISLSPDPTNTRIVQIVAGDLYVSAFSGTTRLAKVGTGGLPTLPPNTMVNLPGTAISNLTGPYSFVFFDRDPIISGYDLLYVANEGAGANTGILKFYFDGTEWQSAGAVQGTASGSPSFFQARGLAGYIDCNGDVQLFTTIMSVGSTRATRLHKFTDNTAYNANITSNGLNLIDVLSPPIIDYTGLNFRLGGVAVVSKPKRLIRSNSNIAAGDYGEIYIKSGATATLTGNITIAGTLTVESGAILDAGSFTISTSATNNDVASVFMLSDGATLRTAHPDGITASTLAGTVQTCIRNYGSGANYEYTGTIVQTTGDGLPANLSATLQINNSAGIGTTGVSLSQATTITGTLNLALGKLTTTTVNLASIEDGANVINASSTSFVNGPLKKIGDEDFTFPVGKGGIYAPIGISGGIGATVTDEFTAEYLRTNPQTPFGNQYGTSGINHVSYVEYWTLERDILSIATKLITLDVHPTSFCIVEATTFVSQFDGTFWTNEPSTGSVFTTCNAPYRCGTLTTNTPISNFTLTPSIFTLGTTDPFATNPLPIKLINFSATKISNALAVINWDLAECCSRYVIFELEKSTDSRNFTLASSISGSETNKFYFYNDSRLGKGITYYRLKMTDNDGSVKYSKVIAIVNEEKGFVITSIAPNPVQHTASLTISAAKQSSVDFKVYDMTGNMVKQWQSSVASGINVVNMEVSALANGTYHVLASSADDKAVFRFIKQ